MPTNLPIIHSQKSKKRKKTESIIPNWTIFSLCFISTLLIISFIKAYLPLLLSALIMLFVWSQITKPVAEIKTKATVEDSNQLNLFHRQYKIGKKYAKIKKVLEAEEGQQQVEDRKVA